MPSVTFRLQEPNGTDPTLVYLFFRANNLEVKYSTSQRIPPKFWNAEKQKAKETRKFSTYAELNTLLGNLENCITNAYRKCINDKIIPTPDLLKNELNLYLQKEKRLEKNLINFAEYIANNTDRKPGTIKQLKQTIRLLKDFSQSKNYNLQDKPSKNEQANLKLEIEPNHNDRLTKELCINFGRSLGDFKKYVMDPSIERTISENKMLCSI